VGGRPPNHSIIHGRRHSLARERIALHWPAPLSAATQCTAPHAAGRRARWSRGRQPLGAGAWPVSPRHSQQSRGGEPARAGDRLRSRPAVTTSTTACSTALVGGGCAMVAGGPLAGRRWGGAAGGPPSQNPASLPPHLRAAISRHTAPVPLRPAPSLPPLLPLGSLPPSRHAPAAPLLSRPRHSSAPLTHSVPPGAGTPAQLPPLPPLSSAPATPRVHLGPWTNEY
jgi:hypothetical protein